MGRPVVCLLIHLSTMIAVSIGDDIQYGALPLVGNIRGSYLRHKKIRGTLSPSYSKIIHLVDESKSERSANMSPSSSPSSVL